MMMNDDGPATLAVGLPIEATIPKPTLPLEVPAQRREALARGLMHFDVLKAERDQLEKDLAAAREKIHLLELQITEIESTRNTIESRINTCVLQRDEAVSKEAEVRGVLNSIAAICFKYHDAKVD